ncbi:hypothetical protein ACFX13_019645 [Malus domestica]
MSFGFLAQTLHSSHVLFFLRPSPPFHSHKIVVNGLGMVTLLGCRVEMTWKRLIKGDCGIRALTPEDIKINDFDSDTQSYTFDQLTFKVAAMVSCESNPGEFTEELWLNSKDVSVRGGTKSISDILDAAQMICEKVLINMASGHVSMKYGFQGPYHATVASLLLEHILRVMPQG